MKVIRYVVGNGLFVYLIYLALWQEIQGAQNLLVFIVWFMGVTSLATLSEDVRRKIAEKGISVPRWVDVSFDLTVTCVLVWHGWIFSALVYLFNLMLVQNMWSAIENDHN